MESIAPTVMRITRNIALTQWWIQAPLIFRPKWCLKGGKKIFLETHPSPYLRVWMTSPPLILRSGSGSVTNDSISCQFKLFRQCCCKYTVVVAWNLTVLFTMYCRFKRLPYVEGSPNWCHRHPNITCPVLCKGRWRYLLLHAYIFYSRLAWLT